MSFRQKHNMFLENDERLPRKGCVQSPYMEMVWAWLMQMTNLGHSSTHLEYSKIITIRTRLRNNSRVYACAMN